MGEPAKLLVLSAILETVKRENLLENTQKAGDALYNGLKEISKKYSQLILNARGRGTFCAFDMPNAAVRDKFVGEMRNAGNETMRIFTRFIISLLCLFSGIQMGSCGDIGVRFRPALIFAERHAQIVLDKMNEVAKKF